MRLSIEMGSRPGIAESIASFEAANNAPHFMVLLIAGALYAIQALGDVIASRASAPTPPAAWTPPSFGTPPSPRPASGRRGRRFHHRPGASGGS